MSYIQEILARKWPLDISIEELSDIFPEEEVLGIGKFRLAVLDEEERIWKIAWREQGLLANQTEYRVWRAADENLRSMLCPSLQLSESGALLQARVQPVSYEALGSMGHRMVQDLARHGIMDVAINCGLLDGNVVAYDYSDISIDLHNKIYGDS